MSARSKPLRSTSLWLALLASGVGLAVGGTALAQGWGTYEKAFPANPCHDGWAACIVDGERVTPDMSAKGPADMRVGWFDLEPSTAFSPFTGLTEYTGEAPAVAAADAEPAAADAGDGEALDVPDDDGVASAPSAESVEANRKADEAAADRAAARAAEEEARRQQEEAKQAQKKAAAAAAAAQKEEDSRRREADKMAREAEAAAAAAASADAKAAAEQKRKEAEAARKAAEDAERKRKEAQRQEAERSAAQEEARRKAEEEERKRQEAEAAAKAAEAEARQKAEEDRKRREAEEAARRAEQERLAAEKAEAERVAAEKAAAERAAAAEAAAAAGEEPPPDDGVAAVETAPPPPMDDGSCDNLQTLEPPAMLGKMSDGQVQCLEGKLASSAKMTEKKKVSVLLMTNAFSKGDKKQWEELVKRHLDEIDQSDPDLCYKYALYLAGKGSGRASGVIRWANVALENRTVWTGDTYKSRVNSLFKMRAAASQKLWQSAEKEHASSPSEATSSKIDKYRNMTKVNAREWYEYAKVSGKDTTKPLQLCMSAAGTSDYCDGS